MHANLEGALEQLDTAWRAFRHNGKSMTKAEVKAVLEFGISKGYTSTEDLSDAEIDAVLAKVNGIPDANR